MCTKMMAADVPESWELVRVMKTKQDSVLGIVKSNSES